jgi:predicted metal-dependent phosphoesterase TrpH
MSDYKIDTHIHTKEVSPCGHIGAKKMVSIYKKAGYQGIIITDHLSQYYPVMRSSLSWREKIDSFFTGYEAARSAGDREGLTVMPGFELSFADAPNDYLVFGISREWLYEHKDITKSSIEEFSRLIKGKEALIVQAHPYRPGLIPRKPGHIHGVEVFNGNARHDSQNNKALAYARENGLIQTSGSDAHQREDCARGGMIFSSPVNSIEDFVSRLKLQLNDQDFSGQLIHG